MPIYEYRCEKCGDFERSQRITDAPLQRCPTCRRKVRRLISNTSFQLKGSGWYVTDYGRGGSGKNGADSSTGETQSDSKSDSKADAKGTGSSDSTGKSGKSDTGTKGGAKADA